MNNTIIAAFDKAIGDCPHISNDLVKYIDTMFAEFFKKNSDDESQDDKINKKRRPRKRMPVAEQRHVVRVFMEELGALVPSSLHHDKVIEKMPSDVLIQLLKNVAQLKAETVKQSAEHSDQGVAQALLEKNDIENLFELLIDAIFAMNEDGKMDHAVFDELTVILKNM